MRSLISTKYGAARVGNPGAQTPGAQASRLLMFSLLLLLQSPVSGQSQPSAQQPQQVNADGSAVTGNDGPASTLRGPIPTAVPATFDAGGTPALPGPALPGLGATPAPAAARTNPPLSPNPSIVKPGLTGGKAQENARKLTSTVYEQELKIQSMEAGAPSPHAKPASEQGLFKPYAADTTATAPPLETINLQKPELKALVTINRHMDPFGLDASSTQTVTLRDVLNSIVQHNLDIADSRAQTEIQKWGFYNALSGFLPDATFNDYNFLTHGILALPGGFGGSSSSAGSSTGSSTSSATSTGNSTSASALQLRGQFHAVGGSFTYHVYQGGKVLFGSLEQRHNLRAQRAQQNATIQDTLLAATKQYYNLMLQQALLQNQIRAVATDEEQFRQNIDLEKHGLATYLDVLQAKTQLARDRQNLIDQQTARRTAAINLADLLNANLGQDLSPSDAQVRKVRLVDPDMPVANILKLSIDNRPELRQYEELRMAAKRAIVVAGANLQPKVNLAGGIYGVGSTNLNAISFLSLNINWLIKGFGTTDWTNIQQARWQARQALIRANRELLTVLEQVRTSLLQSLSAEKKIDETSEEVASATEELRLARLRFEHGLGTNLDVLTGQRDLTAAYIDKATAIVNYNIAQVQLVHDLGLTSVDTVTSGRLLH